MQQSLAHLSGHWNYPTSISFGVGQVQELPHIINQKGYKNPLIVTDKGLAQLSVIKDIERLLTDNQIPFAIFSDIKPNPTSTNIQDGIQCFKNNHHDVVVSVGGGSSLDAGKAIALMVEQTIDIFEVEDIGEQWKNIDERLIKPVIAIPTTAGTGSEVGRASVIVDEKRQHKAIIFHPKMMPGLVLADPSLTAGLPAHITAATGMDAFVHNFEAFMSPSYHPMAEGIAIQAMLMIKTWLVKAYIDGNDLRARSEMLVASMMGATAFQKGLGGVHALAHPLGAMYDKHHGLLNAILLPYVIEANKSAIGDKALRLVNMLSISDTRDAQNAVSHLIVWICEFRTALKIPHTLKDIGLSTQDAKLVGERAEADPSAGGNPIKLSAKQYQAIFENAVNGTLQAI
jgi:alcohol dehydrogenase class IV